MDKHTADEEKGAVGGKVKNEWECRGCAVNSVEFLDL